MTTQQKFANRVLEVRSMNSKSWCYVFPLNTLGGLPSPCFLQLFSLHSCFRRALVITFRST